MLDRACAGLVICLLALNSCSSTAKKNDGSRSNIPVDTELEQRLSTAIVQQLGSRIHGLALGILAGGRIKYVDFGHNQTERFEIASLSKIFTGLMYARALDLGVVKPETTLAEIRPEWKGQKTGSIRLVDLATHRSGLPRFPCNYRVKQAINPFADYTDAELIESITDKSFLENPKCTRLLGPTSTVLFSNWGMALLANAIQAATQKSYATLLSEWITIPLDLSQTSLSPVSDPANPLTPGFDANLKSARPWDHLGMVGSSGVISSVTDLMKLALAIARPTPGLPLTNAITRATSLQFADPTYRVGFGWFLTKSGALWHNGMNGSSSGWIKIWPKEERVVIALSDTAQDIRCLSEAVEKLSCNPIK